MPKVEGEPNKTPVLLLVEDDGLVALPMEEAMVEAGFDVVLVYSGDEAIAALDKAVRRFSALITDIRLGAGPSGWDVAHHARQLDATVPVVYVSGDSAMDWSANGVPKSIMLQKPFANAQLVAAVTSLLNDMMPRAAED